MIDPLLLLVAVAVCILIGVGLGFLLFAPGAAPAVLKLPKGLPPHVLARITHEAYRAYANSIGDLSVKGWVGIEEREREQLTRRVRILRENIGLIPAETASLKTHLLHAIVRLFG